jgi:hypothetical protein
MTMMGYTAFYVLSMVVTKPLSKANQTTFNQETKCALQMNAYGQNTILQTMLALPLGAEKQKEMFHKVLNSLTLCLKSEQIEEPTTCILCSVAKEDEEVEWMPYGGVYAPIHKGCIEAQAIQEKQIIEAENKNTKYLPLSIILSLVGAIVGMIVPLLVQIFASYFIGILYALIPFCAFFGYKLGKAPRRVYTTIIVIVESLLVSVGSIVLIYAVLAGMGNVSFVELIKDPDAGFAGEIAYSLLFTIIGIAVTWGYITKVRTNK